MIINYDFKICKDDLSQLPNLVVDYFNSFRELIFILKSIPNKKYSKEHINILKKLYHLQKLIQTKNPIKGREVKNIVRRRKILRNDLIKTKFSLRGLKIVGKINISSFQIHTKEAYDNFWQQCIYDMVEHDIAYSNEHYTNNKIVDDFDEEEYIMRSLTTGSPDKDIFGF